MSTSRPSRWTGVLEPLNTARPTSRRPRSIRKQERWYSQVGSTSRLSRSTNRPRLIRSQPPDRRDRARRRASHRSASQSTSATVGIDDHRCRRLSIFAGQWCLSKDVDDAAVLVDPVDDPIGASAGTVTPGERPEQGLADRRCRLTANAASQNSSTAAATASGSRRGDGSPGGRLETNIVLLSGFAGHAPVMRRRAKSWRTVARSAPGSLRSRRPGFPRCAQLRRRHRGFPRSSPGPQGHRPRARRPRALRCGSG